MCITDNQGSPWAWVWNKVLKVSMYQGTKGTLGAKACVAYVQTYS